MPLKRRLERFTTAVTLCLPLLLAGGCAASDARSSCIADEEGFVQVYGYGVSTAPPDSSAPTGGAGESGAWRVDGCAGAGARTPAVVEAEQGWAVCMAAAGLDRFTAKREPFQEIAHRFAAINQARDRAALGRLRHDERVIATADFECARDSGYLEALQTEPRAG